MSQYEQCRELNLDVIHFSLYFPVASCQSSFHSKGLFIFLVKQAADGL